MRNRNSGLTSSRSTACRIPRSNPSFGTPLFVEAQARRNICARHRDARTRGEPAQRGSVLRRPRRHWVPGSSGAAAVRACGVTDEDAASTWRFTYSRDLVWTANRDLRQRRTCRGHVDTAQPETRGGIGLCKKGGPDLVGTGRHWKLYLQAITRATATTLPLSCTGWSLLFGEEVHPRTVDGQLELELFGRYAGS